MWVNRKRAESLVALVATTIKFAQQGRLPDGCDVTAVMAMADVFGQDVVTAGVAKASEIVEEHVAAAKVKGVFG